MRNGGCKRLLPALNLAVLAGVFGVVGMSAPALAGAKVCAASEVVAERLGARFNEDVKLTGMTQSNYVVQVYASNAFKTWTLTVTKPGGPTCLLASGKGKVTMEDRLARL